MNDGKNLLHSKMTQLGFVRSLGGGGERGGGGGRGPSLSFSIGGASADDNVDPLLPLLLRNEGTQQGTETAD